tara:strand:- start:42 stop:632 length:591 start_codon:yes stop_codon:yes gene_type:complete
MTRKEILKKRRTQRNADIAEHNRRVRYRRWGLDEDKHYSRKKSKDYKDESQMEPWRRLQKPENETPQQAQKRKGIGGETYIHSGVTTRNRSRSLPEQIKYMKDAEKSGEGRITKYGRKNIKTMQAIIDRGGDMSPFQYNLKKAREAKKKKEQAKKKVKEEGIDVRTLMEKERNKDLPKTSLDKGSKNIKKLYDGWL